jgi:hypothetical protein
MVNINRIIGRVLLSSCIVSGLSACSGDRNPVRDVLVSTGIAPQSPQAQDFVATTRPAALDYKPVGVSAPPRRFNAKSQAEIEAAKAELDALRTVNDGQAAMTRAMGAAVPPVAPVTVPAPVTMPDSTPVR